MSVREATFKGRHIGYVGGATERGFVAWDTLAVDAIGSETVLRDETGTVRKFRRMTEALDALVTATGQ